MQNETAIRVSQRRSSQRGIVTALIVLLGLLGPTAAFAQTFTLAPPPYQTVLDNSGNIVNAGCVWTYVAGTVTPVDTYSTSSGTLNANPIIADSAGRFVVYLLPGSAYKFVYENVPCNAGSHGTVLKTQDNILATPASGLNVDVTGTAGEAITAGDAVYLSQGIGGTTVGRWYKTDADLTYASTTATVVGMAPSTISSGTSGSIRLVGRVTGLTGLTAGLDYYASATAGAVTVTQPTNAVFIGRAESTTVLVLRPEPVLAPRGPPDGRLTLTTAVPVTVSDVTAATTLYYTPYGGGNQIDLFDGSRWVSHAFAEISIAVPATTVTMYDVFAYSNAGVVTLELTAWTNDTTRATALTTQHGVLVKTGATTRRYLGSFRTTGVSGQTEDSLAKRYVWNYYHRVPRALRVLEGTDSWSYTLATYQQANNSAANQVDVVVGVAEVLLELTLLALSSNGNADVFRNVAIGQDGITPVSGQLISGRNNVLAANTRIASQASLRLFPAVGRHYYTWLETSVATGTTTWSGDGGDATVIQSGLHGSIEG